MRLPIVTLVVLAALTQAASALAQQRPAGTGAVAGTLRDAASGQPLVRGSACVAFSRDEAWSQVRCVRVDSSGGFRLEGVPSGPRTLRVACATYPLLSQFLDSVRVVVPDGGK